MSAGKNNQLKLNVTVGRSSSTPLFRGTFYALYSPDNFNVANYTNNHKRNVIAFICELPVKHRLTARRSHIKYMTTPTIYIRCFKNRVVGRSRRLTLPGIPLTPCMRPRVCVGADTYFFCFYLNKKVL
jgi:hypothetical protein